MATVAEHLELAQQNGVLARGLALGGDLAHVEGSARWVVTAAFYAGVHWAQALIVKTGRSAATHEERDGEFLAALRELHGDLDAHSALKTLSALSRGSRYEASPRWYMPDAASESGAAELALVELDRIRRVLEPLLSA